MLDDLAVPDSHHVNAFKMDLAVSWGDAKKRPFVCAVVRLVCRHPVAVGDLPMDMCMKVGERFTNIAVELAHTGFVGSHVWLGSVIDEVVSEEFLNKSKFPRLCTSSVFRRTTAFAV